MNQEEIALALTDPKTKDASQYGALLNAKAKALGLLHQNRQSSANPCPAAKKKKVEGKRKRNRKLRNFNHRI